MPGVELFFKDPVAVHLEGRFGLGTVTINSHSFAAEPVRQQIGSFHVLGRCLRRKIHGLRHDIVDVFLKAA
jgi:hypothetical protein